MNWVILVPRGAEHQAVRRGLTRRRSTDGNKGTQGDTAREPDDVIRAIAIPAGGAAISFLDSELQECPASTQFLVMGLCGGLSDRTSVGTIVIYDTQDRHPFQQFPSVNGVTIDRVLCLASEKRELAQESGADVVDMESRWIVEYLQPLGFAVSVIRVVSDDARADLPNLADAFDASGNLLPMKVAIAFIKTPIAALRLIRGSLTALIQLEAVVETLDLGCDLESVI